MLPACAFPAGLLRPSLRRKAQIAVWCWLGAWPVAPKRDFDDMAIFLSRAGYTVYCIDVPGRGGSSWLPSAQDYTLDTYAVVLAALIDQQGWGAVH